MPKRTPTPEALEMLQLLQKQIGSERDNLKLQPSDHDPARANEFTAALQETRQSQAAQARQRQRMQSYLQAGMPAQPVEEPDQPGAYSKYLQAGLGQQPAEQQNPGFIQRLKDYLPNKWNEIIHGEGPAGTQLHPTERVGSALGLISDPIDFLLGGFTTAFSANPKGGLLDWLVLRPFNAAGAAAGELGRGLLGSLSEGPAAGTDLQTILEYAKAGYMKRANGTNFITRALTGNPTARQWIERGGGDVWTKWADFGAGMYLGPKFAKITPIAPVFRFSGQLARVATDRIASGIGRAAEATAATNPGLSRFLTGVNEGFGAVPGFKELTNATPEYRAAQAVVHEKLQPVSEARQLFTRISNISRNIGRKLRGDPNVTLYGDLLSYHPDPAIAAQASNPGYLPTQIILHGAEAGSEGAFFTHRAQVLSIAADLGLPVEPLNQAITELQRLSLGAGERMVKAGLMEDRVFQQNAGHWIRRIYRTNLNDQMAREGLINEMVERGIDSTRANNLVMALQESGQSGPAGLRGVGLSTIGNVAKAFKRKLGTAEERIEFMPEYNALDQVGNALLGQYKAAAIHEVFKTMEGDSALSAANQIKNYGMGRKLDFSQTPRIQNMLREVTEAIKLHQDRLDNRLEKVYNARHKWVQDQDQAVRNAEKAYTQHVRNEPGKPVEPQAPDVSPSAYKAAKKQHQADLSTYNKLQRQWEAKRQSLNEQVESARADVARAEKARQGGGSKELKAQYAAEERVTRLEQEVEEHAKARPQPPIANTPKQRKTDTYKSQWAAYQREKTLWGSKKDTLARQLKEARSQKAKLGKATARLSGQIDAKLAKANERLASLEEALRKHEGQNPGELRPTAPEGGPQSALYEKLMEKYARELSTWQARHKAWQQRQGELATRLRESQAEYAKREKFLSETDAEVGKWFDEADRLQRKHELLQGGEATDLHANDALSIAEEKLGFQIVDPAERQRWFDSWKNAWETRGIDIFDTRNAEAPVAPKGVPQELVEKVDQNITPAIALDETLSAPAEAFSADNHPPGWELWEGRGNRQYGAMEGRWGPTVIRRFIEDAIDPHRFDRNQGPILGLVKALSDQFKALKLYYNPSTKYGIEIQSFWEAKATANAAGVKFNPRRYIQGMKEYKKWIEGEGEATPVVQAMLQGVRESGAGFMTAMSPEDLPNVGKEGRLRQFANANRQKFIEVQQYPKAGTAAVLIDAGFSPAEAGIIAERGFGARGGMGGVETHGVMQIAEGLNKYGIAIFTSYPLHSINRFFQIMAHKPEVLMQYPVIRQYLMNQVPGSEERIDRGEVRPTMVPIPGLKNEKGEPVWIDVANLIPHGGATQDLRIGGPLSPFENPIRQATEARDKLIQRGAAPDIANDEMLRRGYQAVAPSVAGSAADAMMRSLQGLTRTDRSISPESPPMAAGRFIGFPMQYAENATDRALELEKVALPGRVEFQETYIQRVRDGLERPADYSGNLKKMDLKEAYGAQSAAQRYLSSLLADKSLDEQRAKTMIRRQVDWIISINAHIQDQTNLVAAQQAQEMQDAEEADQYSQAGAGAGP